VSAEQVADALGDIGQSIHDLSLNVGLSPDLEQDLPRSIYFLAEGLAKPLSFIEALSEAAEGIADANALSAIASLMNVTPPKTVRRQYLDELAKELENSIRARHGLGPLPSDSQLLVEQEEMDDWEAERAETEATEVAARMRASGHLK